VRRDQDTSFGAGCTHGQTIWARLRRAERLSDAAAQAIERDI
jgi:hypothetical protein